jgi:hypothetical protein
MSATDTWNQAQQHRIESEREDLKKAQQLADARARMDQAAVEASPFMNINIEEN